MATNFNNEQPQTLLGTKTPRAKIFKSESHKLHQAFTVAEGKTIVQGMPVQLEKDGSIAPYLGAEGSIYLGIAVTDNISPAYQGQRNFPVEVTVAVQGYIITEGSAKADTEDCAYVKPTEAIKGGFVVYEASDNPTDFINLTPASTGETMQILCK